MFANPAVVTTRVAVRMLCGTTLLAFFLVGPSLAQEGPLLEDAPSMAERLRRIAEETAEHNPWLGDRAVRELRRALEQPLPPQRKLETLAALAGEELRIGEPRSAIDHLQQALALVGSRAVAASPASLRKLRDQLQLCWLRLAEDLNCVAHSCCDSCLFPFSAAAVHSEREPAERALELQRELLRQRPRDARMRWLANVTARALGALDSLEKAWQLPDALFASDQEFPRFHNAASELGLARFSLSGGVIVEDLDGDLDLDVITSSFDPRVPLCFLRNDGDEFTDVTADSGLETVLGGLNLVPADYDNDGDLDFVVLRGAWLDTLGRHPNSLVRNEGNGRFRDVTIESGMADPAFPTQTAAWGDYDQDGDLDLYVGVECKGEHDWSNQLWRNEGDGTFVDVAAAAGVTDGRFTKGVAFGDFDGDQFPDLYVSNLGLRNRLYHNQGDGTFRDVARRLGVTEPRRSFPTWFWDVNNDGILDLFVASYDTSFESLVRRVGRAPAAPDDVRTGFYLGDGEGGFVDAAQQWAVDRLHPAMGANFGDIDSDGHADFYLGTGFPEYDALMPNLLLRNAEGDDGSRLFHDVTTASGTGHLQKGHGVAFADLDGDFDVDLFAQMGGAFPGDGFADAWFRNPGNENHLLKLRLVGTQTNRSAIGARVHLVIEEDGERRHIYHWVNSGGSFGANPLLCEIGTGRATVVERLEIDWPTSESRQVFEQVRSDQLLRITEGSDAIEVLERP